MTAMFNTSSTTPNSRFQSIFNDALKAYKNRTGKDLSSHPLLCNPIALQSPGQFLTLLQREGLHSGINQPGSSHDTLTGWLDTTVDAVNQVFQVIGPSVSIVYPPAGVIFAAMAFLLSAAKALGSRHDASQGALADLFRHIEKFIKRLETYTKVSPTPQLQDVIVNVMVEVLSILSIATKTIEQGNVETVWNELLGNTEIKDALRRLEELTQEEALTAAAQALDEAHRAHDEVIRVASEVERVERKVKGIENRMEVLEEGKMNVFLDVLDKAVEQIANDPPSLDRHKLRRALRGWLSSPDPSVNYKTALQALHEDTTTWFTQGDAFADWKMSGSLLWIYGRPGTGKSVLTSAVIQNINSHSSIALPFVAYFFFDFKDVEKQDTRALLSSFLVQLSDQSDSYCDKLLALYSSHRRHSGLPKPTNGALAGCLEEMLKLPRQVPAYLIIDAIDECPDRCIDHWGIPSSRKEVLELVKGLIDLHLPTLRLFATSRPENDIRAIFKPLNSVVCTSISLNDEEGQKSGIVDYISYVVHSVMNINGWGEEHKILVIKTLSDRADGMYRWVSCQLERLRRCVASQLQQILDELPKTLDETYARILREIPDENQHHAHLLLQCLAVAVRPLQVKELAGILAIDFAAEGTPTLDVNACSEDQEQTILLACSSLVTVINHHDSRLVQFSHFSVKEFLTSEHLFTLQGVGNYRVLLESAHTIMARACLAVLLRLDHRTVGARIASFPLTDYAVTHFGNHAEFGNVISHIGDGIDALLDAEKPHFALWLWTLPKSDPSWWTGYSILKTVPLYYVAELGFLGMTQRLISKRPQDASARRGYYGTPLHAAVIR